VTGLSGIAAILRSVVRHSETIGASGLVASRRVKPPQALLRDMGRPGLATRRRRFCRAVNFVRARVRGESGDYVAAAARREI